MSVTVRNLSWTYFYKMTLQLSTIVVQIYLLKNLSVDDYGVIGLLSSSIALISTVSVAPFGSVLARFIPEYWSRNELNELGATIRICIYGAIGLIIVIVVLIHFSLDDLKNWLSLESYEPYFNLFVLYIVVSLLQILVNFVLTSFLYHPTLAKIVFLQSVFLLVAVFFFGEEITLRTAVIIFSFSNSIVVVSGIIFLSISYARSKTDSNSNGKAIKRKGTAFQVKGRKLKYWLFSLGNGFGAGIIGNVSDVLVASIMLGANSVGIISFAHRFFQVLNRMIPLKEFSTVIRPVLIRRYSTNNDINELIFVSTALTKLLVPVFFAALLWVVLLGPELIKIIASSEYLEAYPLMIILFAGAMSLGFFYSTTIAAVVLERMDLAMYCKAIAFVTIPTSFIAADKFGLIGIVFVTMVGDFLRNCTLYHLLKKYHGFTLKWSLFFNFSSYLLIFSLPILVVKNVVSNDYATILIGTAWMFLITIVLLANKPILNQSEFSLMQSMLKNSRFGKTVLKISRFTVRYFQFL